MSLLQEGEGAEPNDDLLGETPLTKKLVLDTGLSLADAQRVARTITGALPMTGENFTKAEAQQRRE